MSDLINAHIAHLKAAGCSHNTIYRREQLLRRLDADLPHGILRPNRCELERWFAPFAGWTLYTYWEGAYALYAWASSGHDPYLEWNPMDDLTRPHSPDNEPRPASAEQIAFALERLTGNPRLGVLIATLQGLRCAEICGLERERIDRDNLPVKRKGGKTQLLPIHELLWDAVAGLPPGPVVRTSTGRRYTSDRFSGEVSMALTAIGLPELTLHRFRASFATRLHDEGTPIGVIQDLMGHASVITTRRYIQVREAQRRLAISTLRLPTATRQEAA